MKKIILFILLLFFVFIKPNINVYADSAVPIITWYEAIITNPNGAKTYNSDWSSSEKLDDVIPYESEVIVLQEYSNYNILYNNKEYWVSAEDIAIKNQEFSLGNAYKLVEKVAALNPYETRVYSGPSTEFKLVGTLPANTEFNYEYVIKYKETNDIDWVYVECDNVKGWILTTNGRGDNELAYKTDISIKLLDDYKNTYTDISIPKGTILKCFYIYNSYYGQYQVDYNGKKIWIYSSGENIFEIMNNDDSLNTETSNDDIKDNKLEENLSIDENNNNFNFYIVLYLSLGAAVLVSLTALVTIILMNKKNKNNCDNSINNNQININHQNNINSSSNEVKNETNLNDINKNN